MHGIRIIVNNTAALDGTSELTQETAGVTKSYDAALGLEVYTLDNSVVFGAFDPGKLIGPGVPTATYNLVSCTLVPAAGAPVAGSTLSIQAPPLPSSTRRTYQIAALDSDSGIFNDLIQTVPLGHRLSFSTPDAGGPWIIDCLFDRLSSAKDFLSLIPATLV